MKKYILLILIFLFSKVQSQNITVIDSTNHKPITFVNVYFSKNNGTYTNENGVFNLNNRINDTIKLTHISYNDFEIIASNIKDTIILSPNSIILKEILVNNGKKISKYIDFPKKNSSYSSFPVISKSEIVTLVIPNKDNIDSFISKLDFKFEKKKSNDNALNTKTALRVNIYSSKNKKIKTKIYSSDVFIIDATKKDKIEVDLDENYIELEKNGLFIGIEVIGDIDNNGNILNDKTLIRPILTSNTIEDYNSETYLKYSFDKKLILNPINDILEKSSGDKINRNLSFGITLIK
jgi:hypothetical protein